MVQEERGAATSPSGGAQDTKAPEKHTTVNVLCLSAAVIGLASVFCAWGVATVGSTSGSITIFHSGANRPMDNGFTGADLFIAALVASLYTPIAGLGQVCGISIWFIDFRRIVSEATNSPFIIRHTQYSLGIGFWLAVASASIMLVSFAFPMGPGFGKKAPGFMSRLATFKLGPRSRDSRSASRRILGRSFIRTVRANKTWASVLVVVMLLSLLIVSIDNDFFRKEPPLQKADGGVRMEVNWGTPRSILHNWSILLLDLSDGLHSVSWALAPAGGGSGAPSTFYLGSRALGPLNISLEVYDLFGDQTLWIGDVITIIVHNSTGFAQDTSYSIGIWPTLPISDYGATVHFKLHGERLDSWVR